MRFFFFFFFVSTGSASNGFSVATPFSVAVPPCCMVTVPHRFSSIRSRLVRGGSLCNIDGLAGTGTSSQLSTCSINALAPTADGQKWAQRQPSKTNPKTALLTRMARRPIRVSQSSATDVDFTGGNQTEPTVANEETLFHPHIRKSRAPPLMLGGTAITTSQWRGSFQHNI